MSQQSLKDLLRGVEETEEFKRASGEGGVSGAWDIDLPENQEYRAIITDAKYGPSKSSGALQATITLEVQEPSEYAGAKLQGYFQMPAQTEGSARQLNSLLGALQASTEGFADNDVEGFVQSWADTSVVIAVNKWGAEMDRTGLRWVNRDTGQRLRSDVKPPKANKGSADLRPDVNIPKPAEEVQSAPIIVDVAEAEPVQPPAAQPAQTTTLPGGVNLPPGLRG